MDKNLLTAVALSILVYALWFGVIDKHASPKFQPQLQTAAAPGVPVHAAVASAVPGRPASESVVDRKALEAESDAVTFGKADALIDPRGAAIVGCRYHEPLGTVELVINPQPGFLATFPELSFRRDKSREDALVYRAKRGDGLEILKEFLPEGSASLPRLRITLSNPGRRALDIGGWTLSLGPGLGTIPSEVKDNSKVWSALGLLFGEGGLQGKIERFKPGEHAGPYRWLGVDNRYFLAAVLPAPQDLSGITSALPPEVTLTFKGATLEPGKERAWEIPYYIGAKGHTWLSRYGAGLERSIDFGFFAQLGRLVLKALNVLNNRINNWGWSIILLTCMIQVCLFPLTYKSLKSAAAMRKLQPQIAKLQQKYAKEPSRLNAEMMELYKKGGANPLGGCLPMLLQLPVFYALYNALRNAWELHGAGWIFWIKDLSAKDPYYILPVVMGGLMFAQNRLNPAPADPTQAQMMNFMPVIFTFMFLNFPAGLVLYWLTNSLMNAVFQLSLRDHFNS